MGSLKTDLDWANGLVALGVDHPELVDRVTLAAEASAAELDSLGAAELPLTLVHGDFASWNVHYTGTRLTGVIDFALAHLDSRPFELAVARAHRAPELVVAYRRELARHGWPLTDLEESAIRPIQSSFRIGMIAWELHTGLRTGEFDVDTITRQLQAIQR